MIRRHTALLAAALVAAALATPVALANHNPVLETNAAAVGGSTGGSDTSCNVAVTWVQYANGDAGVERDVGGDAFAVSGDGYYLCVASSPSGLDDAGIWKETNGEDGLQTEDSPPAIPEADTYCGQPTSFLDSETGCGPSPTAETPVQLP